MARTFTALRNPGRTRALKTARARSTITFANAAGEGAVGTVLVFTVTGRVFIHDLIAFCTVDVTEAVANATLSLGIAGSAGAFIATPTSFAADIDAGDWWNDASPQAGTVKASQELSQDSVGSRMVFVSSDIILTVGAQALTGGVIVFDAWYEPVTDNGLLS